MGSAGRRLICSMKNTRNTGLTAYQAITEELHAKPGEMLFIPGGSGSFGQMAVPIAKALGLRVIVYGNGRAREAVLLI